MSDSQGLPPSPPSPPVLPSLPAPDASGRVGPPWEQSGPPVQRYIDTARGVLLESATLVEAMPFLVEVGVLLDLFVGIFVLSIIIHHINREFASQDTRRLSLLKE